MKSRSSDLRGLVMKTMARLPLGREREGGRVVVLMYHSIHPKKSFASADPGLFEEQMEWLREQCDVIPFEEALSRAAGSRRAGRPSVAITFDDGYADVHEYGFPVLSRLSVPATIFLTMGLIERDPTVVARLARLQASSTEDVGGLSWSQIQEMHEAGLAFGSHGMSHLNLARAAPQTVLAEARASRDLLEQKLSGSVASFAYPFGKPKHHYNTRTMEQVAASGYRLGATTNFRGVRSTDQPMAIPRIAVTMDSVEMLRAKVLGRLDVIGMYQRYTPAWAGRIISPATSISP
jgi:peptidoglycan/xylan/chitin deacetylase (PgdA/CDA1 family)